MITYIKPDITLTREEYLQKEIDNLQMTLLSMQDRNRELQEVIICQQAALKRMTERMDLWLETGVPADEKESESIYNEMKAAIERARRAQVRPKQRLNDTDRLEFLLRFIQVADIGDEEYIPGVVVSTEDLEDTLTYGPHTGKDRINQCEKDIDMRLIIDRSIRLTQMKGEK